MSKSEKTGVLITNLGSPDAPTKQALRRYLKQFLSDKRVIQPIIPRWAWLLILNGIILNVRPKRSAKLYESVWGQFGDGAPLIDITRKQLDALKATFANSDIEFEMAMRYQNPSMSAAIEKLLKKGVEKLVVFPLYPQYSQTTTESTFDDLSDALEKIDQKPKVIKINDYHTHPLYISALKNSIEKHWQEHGKPQKLIFSFHGIPKIYYERGDIYPEQCYATVDLLVKEMNLNSDEYMVCFQSRFGKLEWLKPYLDETLQNLPSQGITDVQVICPGFSADCLETLEEIEEENKEYFLESGGKKYSYIPALNDTPEHIECLADIIKQNL